MLKRALGPLAAVFFLFTAPSVYSAEGWICTEAASIKQGDSYLVCGVASAENEGDAREKALQRAQKEFDLLCRASLDCRGRPTAVEPLRNSCAETDDGAFKCYRGLRYSFLDDGSGVFGRSTPVGVGAGVRPDVIKPFSIGVGYYHQTYTVTSKDAATTDLPLLTDNYGGIALFMTTAFSHRYALNVDAYYLNNSDLTAQTKTGVDFQFLVGTNMNQSGFKAMLGAGGFFENWSSGNNEHQFSGGQFMFGLGYNSRSASYDFLVHMRQSKSYDDFAFNGDVTDKNTSAAGVVFRYGMRF